MNRSIAALAAAAAAAAAVLSLSAAAYAQVKATQVAAAQVAIQEPWVRGTVPQQKATGAFMRLTAARDLRLVAARSPIAGTVEVHEMKMQDQMMRMRQIPALDLPKHRAVALAPGGYHIMLIDLKQPLSAGQRVAITLVFEDATGQRSEQTVQAPVRALGANPP
ncbi:copper chaperone PCu(A)C [Lysobacter sp. CA199]|uniref:copper chaperone PCu(A)C n=1 Tax=Lysobacter sp. CA199 TaxID=3455608 RepID=UPI003F8D687E